MDSLLAGLRILVIEDDEDSLELLEFFLRDHGADTVTATTAAEARAALAVAIPDVILSDLRLPDEDGCALLTSLRASPAIAHVPAIALTAQAEDAALVRAAKAGFARHIAKPANLPEIIAAITSVTRGESPERSSALPPASARASGDWSDRDGIVALVARSDLAGLVARLNRDAGYRYTWLLRIDRDMLTTVASFDRESPTRPPALTDRALGTSYSGIVERTRVPFVLGGDADGAHGGRDARLGALAAVKGTQAYCGVPILRNDGSVAGVLCHSDPQPIPSSERVVEMLERVARMLRQELGG